MQIFFGIVKLFVILCRHNSPKFTHRKIFRKDKRSVQKNWRIMANTSFFYWLPEKRCSKKPQPIK